MSTQTTRRALIGGAGLAGVALIAPAIAAPENDGSPSFRASLDANDAAARHFNSLPEMLETDDRDAHAREIDRMVEASNLADRATPTNWAEFTRLLNHHCDGGVSGIDDDNANRLLAHAKRLSSKGA